MRVFVLHHFTYSINSLCHFFGRRDFETDDHSRNLALIAIPTLGEAFHNSHHAFPTSATHGLDRWQIDISALVIDGLEKVDLVWDVVRVSPERMAAKSAWPERCTAFGPPWGPKFDSGCLGGLRTSRSRPPHAFASGTVLRGSALVATSSPT